MKRRRNPPNPEVRRCAIYTRKSTSRGLEREFNSLDAQRETCEAYIHRQPGWVLTDEFCDGGYSAANLDRPAFKRMLAEVDAGRIDVVVVYKVDRLSRSLLDFARVMDRFQSAGTAFVSVTQNFSTADAMGRLTLHMLMSFAEFEREMIAERTRDKVTAARRKGKWTGGPVPLGYEARDGKLVVEPREAAFVRTIFSLYVRHRSAAVVARLLNEEHWTTGRRPGRNGDSRSARRWTKDDVARLLRNPLYAGYTQLDGELHEGEHEAIVDRETFEEARAIREGRTGSVADRGRNPDFVLRGLLRCVAARPDGTPCSHPMLPASTRKGGREYRYYRCSARDGEPGTRCTGRPLPAQPIERLVVERIARALATSRELVPTLCERLGRASRELRATLSEELRAPVAVADVEAAERRRAFLERRLASLPEGDVDAGWVAGAIQSFHRIWDALRPEDRRRLLRALVAYVEADPRSHAVTVALAHPDPLAPVRGEAQESFARDREIIRTGLDLGVNYA